MFVNNRSFFKKTFLIYESGDVNDRVSSLENEMLECKQMLYNMQDCMNDIRKGLTNESSKPCKNGIVENLLLGRTHELPHSYWFEAMKIKQLESVGIKKFLNKC